MHNRVSGPWTWSISTEKGAKLLSIDHRGAPLLWSPEAPSGNLWCAGGERTWLAPEYGPNGFFIDPETGEDRVPPELDPGKYRTIEEKPEFLRFSNSCILRSRNSDEFQIRISRNIQLAGYSEGEIQFRITSSMENTGTSTFPHLVSLWELVQLPARKNSFCLMGTRVKGPAWDCLRGGSFSGAEEVNGGIRIPASSSREVKAGLGAAQSDGTLFYHGTNQGYTVKFSSVEAPDPTLPYADTPGRSGDDPGDAAQVYASGPDFPDPFCELELHSPAAALEAGTSMTFSALLICSMNRGAA